MTYGRTISSHYNSAKNRGFGLILSFTTRSIQERTTLFQPHVKFKTRLPSFVNLVEAFSCVKLNSISYFKLNLLPIEHKYNTLFQHLMLLPYSVFMIQYLLKKNIHKNTHFYSISATRFNSLIH